jgi:hypothetical protein
LSRSTNLDAITSEEADDEGGDPGPASESGAMGEGGDTYAIRSIKDAARL